MKNIFRIDKIGFIISVIFGMSTFLSKSVQNIASALLLLLFIIVILFKKNNKQFMNIYINYKNKLDKNIKLYLIIFILISLSIQLFKEILYLESPLNNDFNILKYIIFFMLVMFVNDRNKIKLFIYYTGLGAFISLIICVNRFIVNYDLWNNTKNFNYYRIYFAVDPLAYASIISMFLLFIFSKIFFNIKSKKELILLILIVLLSIFILLVNRGKTAYVSFLPGMLYLSYKKSKKAVVILILSCVLGFQILPTQIKERVTYIVNYEKDPSSHLRTIFWDGAIETIKKEPLIGLSDKNRQKFLIEYYTKKNDIKFVEQWYGKSNLREVHNAYLQYIVEYGIIAGIYLLTAIFVLIPIKMKQISSQMKENDKFLKWIKYSIISSFICYYMSSITETTFMKQVMVYTFSILLLLMNFLSTETKLNNNK